jgi:hypothetical protein
LLTALFVLLLSIVMLHEKHRVVGLIGVATAAAIALGTGEGLAIALGQSGETFSLFTIAGFLLLTVWLIGAGVTMLGATSPAIGQFLPAGTLAARG